MNAQEILKQSLKTTNMVVSSYLGDLSDAELLVRPGPGCHHIAWQLGHLISSNTRILNLVAPGAAPELPAGFDEKHSKESAASDSPKDFLTKAEYETLMKKLDEAIFTSLDQMTEKDFDQPSPESWRTMFPRIGDMMVLLTSHAMMHVGQWVPVRRSLGKPVVI